MQIPLIEGEMIVDEKKRIKNNGKYESFHLMFKCLKSKQDFVTGGVKNRRNAQGVQTFLHATLYHSHTKSEYECEILWRAPVPPKTVQPQEDESSSFTSNDYLFGPSSTIWPTPG